MVKRFLYRFLLTGFKKIPWLNRRYPTLPSGINRSVKSLFASIGLLENYHMLAPERPQEPLDFSVADNEAWARYAGPSYREVFAADMDAVVDPRSSCVVEQKTKLLLAESHRFFPSTLVLDTYPMYDSIRKFKITQIDEKATYLGSPDNYYHWHVETLARMLQLRAFDKETPIYTNPMTASWMKQSLDVFEPGNIRELPSEEEEYLRFTNFRFVSFAGLEMHTIDRGVLETIRAAVRGKAGPPPMKPPYIYVSRDKARHRRIVNEDQLRDMLEKRFGFVTVYAEDYPVAEQYALFASARIVVAVHGPALTNTIACDNTLIIELSNEGHLISCYYRLANSGNNQYILLKCRNMGESVSWLNHSFYGYADMEADIGKLEKILADKIDQHPA